MARFVTRNDLVQRQSDLAVARSNVAAARAQLLELDAEVARRTVRAPVSGRVLKINIRPGEVTEATAAAGPVLLLGRDDRLNVRVDIDEHDAWRGSGGRLCSRQPPVPRTLTLRLGRALRATQDKPDRGRRRADRYLCPSTYLQLRPKALPAYIGQQVDVVLDAQAPAKRRS